MKDIDAFLVDYNRKAGLPYDVATSSGYITAVLDDEFDIAQAIKAADEQMYKVKNAKREQK